MNNPVNSPTGQQPREGMTPELKWAVASLSLGAVAAVLAVTLHIGLVCAILSVCFASKARKLGLEGKLLKTSKLVSVIALALAILMVVVGALSLALSCRKAIKLASCTAKNAVSYVEDPEGYVSQLEQDISESISVLEGCAD